MTPSGPRVSECGLEDARHRIAQAEAYLGHG